MFTKWLQVLVGIFLMVMGFNKFIGFLPAMNMSVEATAFMDALFATGYMISFIGGLEILCGVLLLSPITRPLGALLLAPFSLSIILFHAYLDPSTSLFAVIVAIANVLFLVYHFNHYRPIFAEMFHEHVDIKGGPSGQAVVAEIN